MKNKIIFCLFSFGLFLGAFSAQAAAGTSKVEYLEAIDVTRVNIDGYSAQVLYNQYKKWGKLEETCPEDGSIKAVNGPGFTCISQNGNYSCASIVTKEQILNSALVCPTPSIGIGN